MITGRSVIDRGRPVDGRAGPFTPLPAKGSARLPVPGPRRDDDGYSTGADPHIPNDARRIPAPLRRYAHHDPSGRAGQAGYGTGIRRVAGVPVPPSSGRKRPMSTRAAVLYVCVDRGRQAAGLPAERAFADGRGLPLLETITGLRRAGPPPQQGVAARVRDGCGQRDHRRRHPMACCRRPRIPPSPEIPRGRGPGQDGVTIRYSWEPLAELKAAAP